MNSLLFKIKEFIWYYFRADTIYSTDSHIIYSFCREVLDDTRHYYKFSHIQTILNQLYEGRTVIQKTDLGAGSQINKNEEVSIGQIARTSASSSQKGKMLFRIAHWFKPKEILELGTNLGISAAYLAAANSKTSVVTIEGDPQIATYARRNFNQLKLNNIKLIEGSFDSYLEEVLNNNSFQLFFIDGNHTYEATIKYVNLITSYVSGDFLIIVDDIYWSAGMKMAWMELQTDPAYNLIIDLFSVGILGHMSELRERVNKTLIKSRYKILKLGLFR